MATATILYTNKKENDLKKLTIINYNYNISIFCDNYMTNIKQTSNHMMIVEKTSNNKMNINKIDNNKKLIEFLI